MGISGIVKDVDQTMTKTKEGIHYAEKNGKLLCGTRKSCNCRVRETWTALLRGTARFQAMVPRQSTAAAVAKPHTPALLFCGIPFTYTPRVTYANEAILAV